MGGVLVFLPQIGLLFAMIALLEATGYMSRAAFLMDRVMGRAGLEGRAFVAMLSSVACAVPGIMATRTLPSARDRLATMMTAPLMTCSARLPVYTLLIGLLVPADLRVGPVGVQGLVLFGLYVLGAVGAMTSAWVFKYLLRGKGPALPFYMEMPSYRMPSLAEMGLKMVWDACVSFVRRVGGIILGMSLVIWAMLALPIASAPARMADAGVDVNDEIAVATYQIEHSAAAAVGKTVRRSSNRWASTWRITVGLPRRDGRARDLRAGDRHGAVASAASGEPAGGAGRDDLAVGTARGEKLFTPGGDDRPHLLRLRPAMHLDGRHSAARVGDHRWSGRRSRSAT